MTGQIYFSCCVCICIEPAVLEQTEKTRYYRTCPHLHFLIPCLLLLWSPPLPYTSSLPHLVQSRLCLVTVFCLPCSYDDLCLCCLFLNHASCCSKDSACFVVKLHSWYELFLVHLSFCFCLFKWESTHIHTHVGFVDVKYEGKSVYSFAHGNWVF